MSRLKTKSSRRVLSRISALLLFASTLTGCNFFVDWEDDYLILNEMTILEESPLWEHFYTNPATDYDCAWHCQTVIRADAYRVYGDFEKAKAEAHRMLSANWNVFEFEYDAAGRTIYRYKNKIETSTDTAYLLLEPYTADNVIVFKVSSAEFGSR